MSNPITQKKLPAFLSNPYYSLQISAKLQCIYCKSTTNLYAIKKHQQTKRCKKLKDVYILLNPDKQNIEALQIQQINDMKRQLWRDACGCSSDEDNDNDDVILTHTNDNNDA
jgi:hypothetical protein